MNTFPLNIVPSEMKNMRIEIEEFIELYNKGEAELIDIRVPFETKVWQVNFGLQIPAPSCPSVSTSSPKRSSWLSPAPIPTAPIWPAPTSPPKASRSNTLSADCWA